MPSTLRIGARIGSADPFWVQTRETVLQHAQHLGIDLLPIDTSSPALLDDHEQSILVEEVLAQDLDALICTYLPERVTLCLLEHGLPVVQLTESDIQHPLFVAPRGYYTIAQMVGRYLAERLNGCGSVLVVGGLLAQHGEDGRSRIAGITDILRSYPEIVLHHIPSAWRYKHAYPQIESGMRQYGGPIDAIFGLSDSLALAARDVGRALGVIDEHTVIAGINGDPLALAAIADRSMAATIDTPAAVLGMEAVNLACQVARGGSLPPYFGYSPRLVTTQNVADVAMQKLIAIAELPSRLVGINRQQEQQRLAQLELSREINRRVGSILNRQQIGHDIAELIRSSYGYNNVQLFLWQEHERVFVLGDVDGVRIPLEEGGLLNEALQRNELIFVPDAQHSRRFAPDPRWPTTRSRVIVPIRFGGAILGLLDLHSWSAVQHTRYSLDGLQLLADELGMAMRNADLYNEALRSVAMAEQADQLKTRLLANVSHELRTPLNVILGYSEAALGSPNPYNAPLPAALLHDLRHIYRSGEHLGHLINDLLDLSRAEIDALELFPEAIPTHAFLTDVWESIAERVDAGSKVEYRLALPPRLPNVEADPVRLRQILLNLLSNARTWTAAGHITLGATVLPPYLHLWVEDTGAGIACELQEQIFEPFVTGKQDRRPEGVGLGLSIARRLVALHGGTLTLESQPGRGSTFHVHLPLPSLHAQAGLSQKKPVMLLVSAPDAVPRALAEWSHRQQLPLHHLRGSADLDAFLEHHQPVLLACDLAWVHTDNWQLERLRADPRVCHVPLVVYDDEHDTEWQPGATGIVAKPLQQTTLLHAIEALRPTKNAGPVLIVDDDAQARDLYGRLVAHALPHHALELADDGAAALMILDHVVPSLVLLDLAMPNVDGFAVLRHLRADERTRQVPVLVLSGRTLGFDDIGHLDHGRVTVHSKDVLSQAEVSAALRAALTSDTVLPQPTSRIVKHAIAYIHQHHMRDVSRQEIAHIVGVSKNYLTQIFHQELGISPWAYLNRYRIAQAKMLLRGTGDTISAVAGRVGFGDVSYFGRVFRKQVGCSPHAYREQA